MGVWMQECVRVQCPEKKNVYIDFLIFFPCFWQRYWQFKGGRWYVLLLWLSELWLLLLMLLLLIILKCWMLSFIVCSFFDIWNLVQEKKKAFILCLVVDGKPWGFSQPFIVPVYAFSVVFAFFTKGKNNVTPIFSVRYWLKHIFSTCFCITNVH